MRVLIIFAVVTLTAAASQFPKKTREYAAEAISGVISKNGQVMETNKIIRAQRFLRSTDDSESTTDDVNEGVSEANDLSKEIAEETRWAAEEKKWQEQAKAETALAKLDGEAVSTNAATDNSEPQDSDEELAEESLWLADEKKWDEKEDQGTEATELENEASHEQEDSSSDAEESSESLTPDVLVEGVDSTISKDVETFKPQLSLISNNVLPWIYPNAYARTWVLQFPQYYQVPYISTY